jgi:hypothetical protein
MPSPNCARRLACKRTCLMLITAWARSWRISDCSIALVKCMKEGVRSKPRKAVSHSIVQVYIWSGELALAQEEIQAWRAENPTNRYAIYFAAQAAMMAGDWQDAKALLDEAIQLLPEEPLVISLMGLYWALTGNSEPALQCVARACSTAKTFGHDEEASPIYGVKIPAGYRDWKLIAVDHLLVAGKVDQLRAQLGNDIAIKAFKEGKVPFPDGAIIAAIHWTRVPSEDNNKVLAGPFPGAQSFVVGSPVNVQFMVKDSKKYAATGGWGFADFKDGKPGDKALHETCFPCHTPAKDRDYYVFTHYAPPDKTNP